MWHRTKPAFQKSRGHSDVREIVEQLEKFRSTSLFMFNNCALGARLLNGLNCYLTGIATFITAYRQISLALVIQSIVKSGDLIAIRMKQKSHRLQVTLVAALSAYFAIYVLASCLLTRSGAYTHTLMELFNLVNCFFIFLGVSFYFYTI